MVLLGHSMGGLLSHAVAADSGNKFWELNSDRRFDDIIGPPEVLQELRQYLFFEPLPFVRRVVFLATPHRGSESSRGVVGRVGAGLISDPDHLGDLLARLIKDNRDAFDRRRFRRLPTSIETLAPDSDVLLALLGMRPGPGVTFHSIIGSIRPGGVATATDGIVPYRSAHFEAAASERVVRSDHGVQKNPEAIREVHRILLEHLGLGRAEPGPRARAGSSVRRSPAMTLRGLFSGSPRVRGRLGRPARRGADSATTGPATSRTSRIPTCAASSATSSPTSSRGSGPRSPGATSTASTGRSPWPSAPCGTWGCCTGAPRSWGSPPAMSRRSTG
jgi:hypothetical protein